MRDGNDVSVKDTYKVQYAHFRAMNAILYKIPPLFSVAMGGCWYFAATQLQADRFFAVGASVANIFIIGRFNQTFNLHMTNLYKL
jgi:hypothetical protein